MAASSAWLRRAFWVACAANALDLSTSLIPSPADHLVAIPQRSAWGWAVQFVLLVPAIVWLARRAPAVVVAYRALPIPALPRFVLAAFFTIAIGHVALRLERYPWSPVAMFSSAVPHTTDKSVSRLGYVIDRDGELEAVSFLREGSPWFERHDLGFDYKAGWVMHLYAPTHSTARDVLFTRVRYAGLSEPVRTRVPYSRATGRLLLRRRP